MKSLYSVAPIILMLIVSPAYSAPREKGKLQIESETETLRLSVKDCINLVLRHNLILLDARLNPRINDTDITKAKAEFDPTWEGEVSKSRTHTKPITLFSRDINKNETTEFNTGFNQKLWTGTQWTLAFNNNYDKNNSRFRTLNEIYEEDFTISVSQPLLKDFGMEINEMNITIAANNKKISLEKLKKTLMDQIVLGEKIYWDLVFSLENLQVNRILLQQAQDLEKLNRAQVKAGVLAPIGVLEAEASVASRQEGILVAENQVRDAQDRLLQITNLAEENWDLIILPTDEAKFEKVDIDLKKCLADAHKNRPENKQALLTIKGMDYNIRLADNAWWPSVNVFGNYGLNGIGENYGDSLDSRFFSWTAGIEFSVPLGNRSANAGIIEQKLKKQQVEYNIRRIKLSIEREVREAYRQVITDTKRIHANKVAEELEKRKLEIEEEKLKLGLSTSHDVLEFQADLAEARQHYIRSVIDYKKSLVELSRRTARLLEEQRIAIKKFYPNIL